MRIGILLCDDVNAALQPKHGNYPAMFARRIQDIAPDWETVTFRALDGDLPGPDDTCEGYITTGSRYSVNDGLPWITALKDFVIEIGRSQTPFVGVCFGHQLLASAFGGSTAQSERGWGVGITSNQIDIRKPWMTPFKSDLNLVASHQDQVLTLPKNTQVLASSPFCPFYMLQYKRHIMGVQGHPEFSKAYSRALMDMRKDRIPAERIRLGELSLGVSSDDRLYMQWIINFFASNFRA